MKITLSKELPKYSRLYPEIGKHFSKNEINEQNIALYSTLTGVPLFVIYIYLIQVENNYDLRQYFFDICKFYDYENDVIF